jgi:hypothetical protein
MNRVFKIALFIFASFALIHSASAQHAISRVTIPFAFTVAGTTLPAGEYVVSSLSFESPDTLVISSSNFHHPRSARIMTLGNDKVIANRANSLIFNAYGSRYFLHEIVSPTNSTDAILPTSKQEKKLLVELARNGGGQPVLVAIE